MSQYYSRIHIKVKEPNIWKKFEDTDDASFNLADLAEQNETSFIIDGDWSCMEYEIEGIVSAISKTLGNDGIIIADTTNINVDPYDYCVYYLGKRVHTEYYNSLDYYEEEYEYEEDDDTCNTGDMFHDTDIKDIAGWLNYGEFSLSKAEIKKLEEYGIIIIDGDFEQLEENIELLEQIKIRETSLMNRAEYIEKIKINDIVTLEVKDDNYDYQKVEVIHEKTPIGSLPSDVSEKLAKLLISNRLKYNAKILEIKPLSKRNIHAKSPIVFIGIDSIKTK